MAELPSKVTHEAYWKFLRDFGAGKYPHMRLGQAFMSQMISWKTPHSTLFYTTDNEQAKAIIESAYIKD